MKKSVLCVGGPLDGRMHVDVLGGCFRVLVPHESELDAGPLSLDVLDARNASRETVTYVAQVLGTNSVVFVPDGTPPALTIDRLIRCYADFGGDK